MGLAAFVTACAAFVTVIESVRRHSWALRWAGTTMAVCAVALALAEIAT